MTQRFKNLLPYIVVILAIVLPWFFKPGYLFFTDFVFGPNIILDWKDAFFGIKFLMKILSYVLPYAAIEKIFISATLLIVLLGGKKIAEQFITDKWLLFVVSLFVLFNPFVYDRAMYGQIGMILSLGFMCFALGYLIEYLNKKENKQILFSGLFNGLAVSFLNQFLFFVGVIYVLFLILAFLAREKIGFKKTARNILFAGLIIIAVNLNWILPIFFGKSNVLSFTTASINRQDLAAFQTAGKTGEEALKNVLMMSGFWGKEQYRYIDLTKFKENWGRSFFLLLPIILLGIYSAFKKSQISNLKSQIYNSKLKNINLKHLAIGLIVVYVIAVILAVGVRLPAAKEITYWLFDNVPFYKGLRETQKWAALVVVVYAVFLTLGIGALFKRKIIQDNLFVSKLFLAGIIVMQTPLMLWGFGGQAKPVEYPRDWQEVNDFIVENSKSKFQMSNQIQISKSKCDGKILFLPWHMYMSFKWIGNIVANPANQFFNCPVISGTNMEWGGIYDNSQSEEGRLVNLWLASQGRTDLLDNNVLNIKYIILAKEVDWQNYFWLNYHPYVRLEKETETLILYKVSISSF